MDPYVEYKSSLCSLKNLLGLGCIHFYQREDLMPEITEILSSLNEKLILEGKTNLEDNIELFIQYYEEGMEENLDGGKDEKYLISWTNIYTTIYLELMYNYSYLFTSENIDCHECCGSIGEDEDGNLVFTPGKGNLSSEYIRCGCGKK